MIIARYKGKKKKKVGKIWHMRIESKEASQVTEDKTRCIEGKTTVVMSVA